MRPYSIFTDCVFTCISASVTDYIRCMKYHEESRFTTLWRFALWTMHGLDTWTGRHYSEGGNWMRRCNGEEEMEDNVTSQTCKPATVGWVICETQAIMKICETRSNPIDCLMSCLDPMWHSTHMIVWKVKVGFKWIFYWYLDDRHSYGTLWHC